MRYSVRTPFLSWFGSGALVFTLFLIVAAWGNWVVVLGLAAIFGGCGAVLLFTSAEVSGDDAGLSVVRIGSRARVRWQELERVAEGGGNLVFYTKAGRMTAPSFEFWAGPEKGNLLALLQSKLEERAVPLRFGSLRAMVHVGDRRIT